VQSFNISTWSFGTKASEALLFRLLPILPTSTLGLTLRKSSERRLGSGFCNLVILAVGITIANIIFFFIVVIDSFGSAGALAFLGWLRTGWEI